MSDRNLPKRTEEFLDLFDPKVSFPLIQRGLARLDQASFRESAARLVWRNRLSDTVTFGPILEGLDGRGYLHHAGVLTALNSGNGQKLWERDSTLWTTSLAIADYLIVIADGHVVSVLDARTGTELRRFEIDDSISALSLFGRVVFAGTESGEVYAMDMEKPATVWRASLGHRVDSLTSTFDTIYANTASTIVALNSRTGSERWHIEEIEYFHDLSVDRDSVFINLDQVFVVLDAENGHERWRFDAGWFIRSYTADKNVVFVGTERSVKALWLDTGRDRWDAEVEGLVVTSLAEAGDTVYAGTYDSGVYALNSETGDALWRYSFGYMNNPIYSLVVLDGVLFAGSYIGLVSALNLETGSEIWSFSAQHGVESLSNSGRVLYIKGNRGVTALDSKTSRPHWQFNAGDSILSVSAIGEIICARTETTILFLDAGTGRELRRFDSLVGVSELAIASGLLVAKFDTDVAAFDVSAMAERWRHGLNDWLSSRVLQLHMEILYIASGRTITTVHIGSGKELSKFEAASKITRHSVSGERVCIAMGETVIAVNSGTWSELWQTHLGTSAFELENSKEIIYAAVRNDDLETLVALDARTGSERWQAFLPKGVVSMAAGENAVYTGSYVDTVCAFDAGTGAELWRYEVDGMAHTMTIHENILYIGTGAGSIYALRID